MPVEESLSWVTLLLHPLNSEGPKNLDQRVLDQPHTLLGGAHGRLAFTDDALIWRPTFHIHGFHAIEIGWPVVWRVQLDEPGLRSGMSRRLFGHMRLFCSRSIIEFSFPLVDSQALEDHLRDHLDSAQLEVGDMLV